MMFKNSLKTSANIKVSKMLAPVCQSLPLPLPPILDLYPFLIGYFLFAFLSRLGYLETDTLHTSGLKLSPWLYSLHSCSFN